MSERKLNWDNFDWRNFQDLSLRIAENLIPDCNFQEYLKQGHKQDGIDILSFDKADGSALTIQCKREKEVTTSDIDEIVEEFLKGKFREKSSHFILCTSASLQSPKLQEKIDFHRENLRIKFQIIFDTWDVDFIETHLKDYWDLVVYFFSKEDADRCCRPQLSQVAFSNISPVPHYIPRKIISFINNKVHDNLRWYFAKREALDLKGLFISDRLTTNHICLVGDPYLGKSYYLKQTAWELRNSGYRIQPLLIEIKEHNVQPLEQLLDRSFGAWKNIPFKELLLFIDGLDEVPTDRFIEMINYIREFCKLNRSVNIVLSCRELFFNQYNVGAVLDNFDIYELYPLQIDDIDFYLKMRLGGVFNDFKDEVHKSGVFGMLHHPFYLTNLTEEFLETPYNIPSSKSAVIESFIQRTYKQSKERRIKGGKYLEHEYYLFKIVIQKLAFSLQLAGKNSFQQEEINELFNNDEIELLQHNSLISVSGNSWSFTNAMFQEHLAALLLSEMDFDKILSYCTVGINIKKLKTKWIQTISSIIALLTPSDELFKQLLLFIEGDNLEIIFQTESSKYDSEFKFSILKKLIEKYIQLNTRPILVYEESIGVFIKSVPKCMDFLMDCVANESITEHIKIVCCRIIKNALLTWEQQKRFTDIALYQLSITAEGYYSGHLVEVLAAYKIGDKALVEKLISLEKLNSSHDFRDNLYELIIVLELVDDFYYYGLEGIPALIKHNSKITHGGSERNLEEFLLSANTAYHLSLLIKKNKGWTDSMNFRSLDRKQFLQRLFEKCEIIFIKDPSIIFSIATYLKDLGSQYLREEDTALDDFLDKTKSHSLVVRILIDDIFNDNNWQLGALITPDSFDYLLYEFEEGNYDVSKLRLCLHGLNRKHYKTIDETFEKLCIDATEGEIINPPTANEYMDHQKAELLKKQNDLIHIQSKEAFIIGLKNYFNAFGKKTITEDDLFLDENSIEIRKRTSSNFIFRFLLRLRQEGTLIHLKDCLKLLDQPNYFDDFRAEQILNYSYYHDDEVKKIMLLILEEYYYSNLPFAKFKNCIWQDEFNFQQSLRENLLGQIFLRFKLNTPEKFLIDMVWLDHGGTRSFENAKSNRTTSISQIIIEQLNPTDLLKFRKKIVENIREGIALGSVLGNHFALCKHLKIVEAKENILVYLLLSNTDNLNNIDTVNIYLELGGEKENLLPLFKNYKHYNDYFFLQLMSIFYQSHKSEAVEVGTLVIHSTDATVETKISVSQFLAEVGIMEGFVFLVDQIRINQKSPYHIQNGHPVYNVDTVIGLNQLEDIMYLLVDKKFDNNVRFHDTAKSIVIEWLIGFAGKSEEDLELVLKFLDVAQSKLSAKYVEAIDLNWYVNRVLENFRNSDSKTKSIKEIKQIIIDLKV